MRKTREETFPDLEVNGEQVRFMFTQMPAMAAWNLMVQKIAPALGPAIARGSSIESDASGAAMGNMVSDLFSQLSSSSAEQVQKALLDTVEVILNGEKIALKDGFNLVFQGRVGMVARVLKIAFEVNYENFFEDLAAAMPKAAASKLQRIGQV